MTGQGREASSKDQTPEVVGQMGGRMEMKERIAELEKRLAETQARMPKHSVPMSMMIELEELEEELAELRRQMGRVA
jgi:hypothetical protein